MVSQKDTWRLKAEVEFDELTQSATKLARNYEKISNKRIKIKRNLRGHNKKATTNKPTKPKYSLDQAKQMALIQSQKQLGTNRTPSLAALDHVATYSGGRTRSSGIFGRGGAFKSSATSENQRKFDEQFVRNVRSLIYPPRLRVTMQDVQQMRVKIIESETKKAQEQFKTKQKPNPVAVRNWIRKGYSGTSDGNGEFERNILRECQMKYNQWVRGKSSSSKSSQLSKGGNLEGTAANLAAQMISIAPEIQNLYSKIILKYDQVLQNRKAFSAKKDEASKLLADSDQSLKISSDKQMRESMNRLKRALSGMQNEDGEKDGLWTTWHSKYKLEEEGRYKNGKKEGLWTIWHTNGQKETEGHYKDGERDGLATQWHENGKKMSEGNFKNDKPDGLFTAWYDNGQKKQEGHYKNGEQEGLGTVWYENGQKKSEGHFKNDKPDGLWTGWDESGNKTLEVQLKDGAEVSRKEF